MNNERSEFDVVLNVLYICVILGWLFDGESLSHPKSGAVQFLVSPRVLLSLKICVCGSLKRSMIRNACERFKWFLWNLNRLTEARYDFSTSQVMSLGLEKEQPVDTGRERPGKLTVRVSRSREFSNLNMKRTTRALERAVESNQHSQVKRGNGIELFSLSQHSCWERRKWMCTFWPKTWKICS